MFFYPVGLNNTNGASYDVYNLTDCTSTILQTLLNSVDPLSNYVDTIDVNTIRPNLSKITTPINSPAISINNLTFGLAGGTVLAGEFIAKGTTTPNPLNGKNKTAINAEFANGKPALP